MTKKRETYKCEICGNIVEVLHESVGTLVCCGQQMKLQKENSIDAERLHEKISSLGNMKNPSEVVSLKEKHVPVIEKNSEGVIIKVGSIPHPMEKEHYIEWIEISTNHGESKKFLTPGEKPEVKFLVKAEIKSARAYCNLHGLWKNK